MIEQNPAKTLGIRRIVASASGRYGVPKTREHLVDGVLLTPSALSFLVDAFD